MSDGARLDVQGLYLALDAARESAGLSWRSVAKEAGVSPSTLTRLSKGARPDVDGLLSLAQWVGLPVESFTMVQDEQREPDLSARLALLLRNESGLGGADVRYVQEIVHVVMRYVRSFPRHDRDDLALHLEEPRYECVLKM